MIFGIGVDIAEISRFKRMVDRFGDRIAQRVLTENEFKQFIKRNRSLSFLALRFAAKEAAGKALGTGISQGIGFQSIEVANNDLGKPELLFHGAASEFAHKNKITRLMLSLSDEKNYAVAMVVLEVD